ncbi:OLC1v1033740C2 [Oldenlandia corymbosa var. corymbosa]|nr:OLC1v1033740C2 [Oldenlandia corymbosa var. corymbosa]
MIYLTNVWKITFTHAAAILNVYHSVMGFLPFLLKFIADTLMGNFWMLLFSSLSFCTGMGFLSMSTPPVLSKVTGTCGSYEPECIGDTQRVLFYAALAFIAVGCAGHVVSLGSFLTEQMLGAIQNIENITARSILASVGSIWVTAAVSCFAVLGLPYIRPWSLHFGLPAIFIVVATLIFVSGASKYTYIPPQGSYLTKVFRVFVASASKLFRRLPADPHELHGMSDLQIPRTRCLRCLDKAAIILPDQPAEEQRKNIWKLCTVTEVEATKRIIIRMIHPKSMSFIFIGIIGSLGFTFFVEQAKTMNHKLGKLTVPLTIFWWFLHQGSDYFGNADTVIYHLLRKMGVKSISPTVGMILSMVLGILACVTAAKVESRRLDVVKSHGLLDQPDMTVPMSVFWLLPQFILLGGASGVYAANSGGGSRTVNLGYIGSIVLVYVLGKVTGRGGKLSWFQDAINRSRLDNYYWFLAGLCAINLVVYAVPRCSFHCFCTSEEVRERNAQAQNAPEEIDVECCCFTWKETPNVYAFQCCCISCSQESY